MTRVDIQINQAQVGDLISLMQRSPSRARSAMSAAINRTAESARTRMRRGIRDLVPINYRETARFVSARKGSPDRPGATVMITGSRFRLPELGATQLKKGVRYRLRRGGAWKLIPGTFLASTKYGTVHAWKRRGKKRYPIDPRFGPSVPQLAEDEPSLRKVIEIDTSDDLNENIARQIDRFLKRTRVRGGAG